MSTCPDCDGLGRYPMASGDNGWGEPINRMVPCLVCRGTGQIPDLHLKPHLLDRDPDNEHTARSVSW